MPLLTARPHWRLTGASREFGGSADAFAASEPRREKPLRTAWRGDEQLQRELVFHGLEVPDADPVTPRVELDFTAFGDRAVHAVVVDHELAIDEQLRAIVRLEPEAVNSAVRHLEDTGNVDG